MGFIKTNFSHNTKMVLTDENSKVIAIINIPTGNEIDITDKIRQAIKEDLDVESLEDVSIITSFEVDEFSYQININARVFEDGEKYVRAFELVTTAEY